MARSSRLTKTDVDRLTPGAVLWDGGDGGVKGFGVRCQRANKVYVVKARVGCRQRWLTIGNHGSPWTVETARRRARELLAEIVKGADPAQVRDEKRADITVADLCERYLEAAQRGEVLTRFGEAKKASTLATDTGRIRRHIIPLLGGRKVREVTRDDLQRLVFDIAAGRTRADVRTGPRGRAIVDGGRGTASRTAGLVGGIFAYAVRERLRPDNPARGLQTYRDVKRQRMLSPEELARLGQALAATETAGINGTAVAAIRLLPFSGCRKSEILTLEWSHVDRTHGVLRLPTSKTGAKTVTLGAPALEVLAALPRVDGNPYVLPGAGGKGHLVGLQKVWARIRHQAGLPDVRVHDLRHAFASVGASGGDSLYIVGQLLGHCDPRTTQRYAHLADRARKAAGDRISGHLAAALNGQPAEVVQLAQRRR